MLGKRRRQERAGIATATKRGARCQLQPASDDMESKVCSTRHASRQSAKTGHAINESIAGISAGGFLSVYNLKDCTHASITLAKYIGHTLQDILGVDPMTE